MEMHYVAVSLGGMFHGAVIKRQMVEEREH